jgi:hypothetical protein
MPFSKRDAATVGSMEGGTGTTLFAGRISSSIYEPIEPPAKATTSPTFLLVSPGPTAVTTPQASSPGTITLFVNI